MRAVGRERRPDVSGGGTVTAVPADARAVLEEGLSDRAGRPVRIVGWRWVPLHGASIHPIHRLSAALDDGTSLDAVCKEMAVTADRRAAREVRLYTHVLGRRRLGAPALYAAGWDRRRTRRWLFLEDVGDWRLDWCDTPVWQEAFRWLAGMHAAWHGDAAALRAAGVPEQGAAFYRDLAQQARRRLTKARLPGAVTRFDTATVAFDDAVAALQDGPRTLVHGDLSCKNLMVQRSPRRFRPVDWEWAAVGPAAWDVSSLLAGWGVQKPPLLAAYLDERQRHGDVDRAAFTRTIAACEGMHALWYLRWWIAACRQPTFVDRLLGRIARHWAALGDGRG